MWIFGKFPLWLNVKIGAFLGRVANMILPREKRLMRQHLQMAFGAELTPAEKENIIRGCFVSLGRSLFEVFSYRAFTPETIDNFIDYEGLDKLKQHLSKGKGVILCGYHLSNWELYGAFFPLKGIPFNVIYRQNPNPGLEDIIAEIRSFWGEHIKARGSLGAAREAIRSLRKGECLAVMIDQDINIDGVFVEFFGHPAYTISGPAALALKTGAEIFVVNAWRTGELKHRLLIEGPVKKPKGGSSEDAIVELTATLTRHAEQHIRKHPEQWVWMHKRWKRQPNG